MSARAWTAFATVSTLWGIPYLFIKIAVDDGVPPAFLASVRVALGAAVTRVRTGRAERRVERRSHPMNAPSAWTSCWTTAAGSKNSTASARLRR